MDPATGDPVKKKTRRGSRGGRNRKKKPTLAGENGDESPEAVEPDAVAESAPAPAPKTAPKTAEPRSDEYVPMSEWLDEIER